MVLLLHFKELGPVEAGGASVQGQNAPANGVGGRGGPGQTSTITASSVVYGGGGGGGGRSGITFGLADTATKPLKPSGLDTGAAGLAGAANTGGGGWRWC